MVILQSLLADSNSNFAFPLPIIMTFRCLQPSVFIFICIIYKFTNFIIERGREIVKHCMKLSLKCNHGLQQFSFKNINYGLCEFSIAYSPYVFCLACQNCSGRKQFIFPTLKRRFFEVDQYLLRSDFKAYFCPQTIFFSTPFDYTSNLKKKYNLQESTAVQSGFIRPSHEPRSVSVGELIQICRLGLAVSGNYKCCFMIIPVKN